MTEIKVTRSGRNTFLIDVGTGAEKTTHEVTASEEDIRSYGGSATPERLIHQSFEFLLEREPQESILRSFPLPVIERYFPEYPKEIRKRLAP